MPANIPGFEFTGDFLSADEINKNKTRKIKDALSNFTSNAMNLASGVVAWAASGSQIPPTYVSKTAVDPRDTVAGIDYFAGGVDGYSTWVSSYNDFGGINGALTATRARISQMSNPDDRKAAEAFLKIIQKYPVEYQGHLLAVLSGAGPVLPPELRGRDAPDISDVMAQALGGEGQADFVGTSIDVLSVNATPGLIEQIETIFPDLAFELEQMEIPETATPGIIDKIAGMLQWDLRDPVATNPFAQYVVDVVEETPGMKGLRRDFADIAAGRKAPFDPTDWRSWADIGNMAGETLSIPISGGLRIGGDFGRLSPVIAPIAQLAERQLGRDPETGELNDWGLALAERVWQQRIIGYGLNPDDPDYEDQLTDRQGVFNLVAPAGGVTLQQLGRRTRFVRSVAGSDAAIKTAQEAGRIRKRTGPLGVLAESYRLPIRTLQETLDNIAFTFRRRGPERFFVDGIHGRQGRKVLDTIGQAKTAHPDNIDGQAQYVRDSWATQIPDPLVRAMLRQPTREGAKRVFIQSVLNPGGTKVLRTIQRDLANVRRRLITEKTLSAKERTLLQAEETALKWKLDTTFDNNPMIRYPKQSVARSIVRQPTTRFQRAVHTVFVKDLGGPVKGGFADLAKLVDDLPRFPAMFVPGRDGNPADWLDQNTHNITNYLRRVGVDRKTAQEVIGKLSAAKSQPDFYKVLETEIFGVGGAIDRALPGSTYRVGDTKVTNKGWLDPDLRDRIINLHNKPIENRTRSFIRRVIDDPVTTARRVVEEHVLGKEVEPGVTTPLPSRPTEDLDVVNLPDVDLLISANSGLRRMVRRVEMSGGPGKAAMFAAWKMPMATLHLMTAVLKPAVMIVRIPAMVARIQIEQGLRMTQMGYNPFRGFPEGISILPGGIPIPKTNHRILAGLFGENGWRLLDPDPDYAGMSLAKDNTHMGMFHDAAFDARERIRSPQQTAEMRTGRRRPQPEHYEAGRADLDVVYNDKLDTKIARLMRGEEVEVTDVDTPVYDTVAEVLRWLDVDPWARGYMKHQDHNIRQSTLYTKPDPYGNGAPAELEVDISYEELNRFGADDPNILYHVGDIQFAPAVGTEGLLPRFRERGPDRTPAPWEDGVIEERLHGAPSPGRAGALANRRNHLVLYRFRRSDTTVLPSSSFEGEFYTKQGIPPELLEYLGPDGQWHRVIDVDAPANLATARRKWIENRVEYIRQTSGGDPDVIEAMATGSLRVTRGLGVDTDVDLTGKPLEIDYNNALADIKNVNAEIKERVTRGDQLGTPEQRAELIALQEARLIAIRRRRQIENDHPEIAGLPEKIKLADKRKFRAELRRRWDENPDTMPEILNVERDRGNPMNLDGGLTDDMRGVGAGISAAMYRKLKPLTYADRKGTRGSLFMQAQKRINAELRTRGYSPEDAKAIAYAKAGQTTRDYMYDLNARSSVHRALKDFFWFAPAFQEVLWSWLVKLPSESYWPLGMAGILSKYKLGKQAAVAAGFIKEDAEGESIIIVPSIGVKMAQKVADWVGADVKFTEIVYGKLSGLNMVMTPGGMPAGSTQFNWLIGRGALKYGGVFKEISDRFQPYGPETTLLPQPITHLHEAIFGEPPPWEPLAPAYVKAQWDRSNDIGIQYAYSDMRAAGVLPPRPEDYGTYDKKTKTWDLSPEQEDSYRKASEAYIKELMSEGRSYARGMAWTRLLGSTVSPMSLHTTSGEREAWIKFFNQIVAPEGFGTKGLSDAQHELIDAYLSEHPNSLGHSVFYSQYGRKQRDLPFEKSLDDNFFDEYHTGERETMEPFDFSQKLMATESRRFYQAQQDAVLNKISPTNDPWELLTQGHARTGAILANREAHNRWLELNPEADALLTTQRHRWADAKNVPVRSYAAERIAETVVNMKLITPMLLGEEAIRPRFIRQTMAELAQLQSEEGEFGEPRTPTEKAIAWWYDNVMEPYVKKTAPVWQDIQDLSDRGINVSHLYDRLRRISNQAPSRYRGQRIPTPEEVFWGNKTPAEQEATRWTWASRPILWLTDFQMDQVGYETNDKTRDFFDDVAKFDQKFWDFVNTGDKGEAISSSSKYYDQLFAMRDKVLAAEARRIGPQAVELLRLSEAAPHVRLTTAGFGTDAKLWGEASEGASGITNILEKEELSPRHFSKLATAYKIWFYNTIEQARKNNDDFDDLLTDLSYSFPRTGGGWRQGALLYEAVFFGNFDEDNIPDEITRIGA